MKKSTGFLNRGFTYVEVVASLAILGMCVLILVPVLSTKKRHETDMRDHLRAMALMISEADLLRSHAGDPPSIGRHAFSSLEKPSPKIPSFTATYDVNATDTAGLMKIKLRVVWQRHGRHQKEMDIYVYAP